MESLLLGKFKPKQLVILSEAKDLDSSVATLPQNDTRFFKRSFFSGAYSLGLTLLIAASFSSSAAALRIVPSYQVVKLEPGKKAWVEVKVHNDEKEKLRLTPSSKDWFVLPENEEFQAKDWLKVKKKKPFVLEPGESATVLFRAKAPKKAVGELVAMATFLKETESASMVNLRMSVAVYLAMIGTEEFEAEILGFGVDQSQGNLKVGCVIENKGNVHVRPGGKLAVIDENDRIQANLIINAKNPIYPGKNRFVYGVVNDFNLAAGHYKILTTITDTDRGRSISHPPVGFQLKKNGDIVLEKKADEKE